ncbi:hypothetical protein E5170_09645 [Pseudomonas atacamensis]|uniref:Uncharacterized protein n=1 Tax=Pseudomonas atacamensis TaxID=2565368 RepID=A0AAQ2I2K0_9PSED|nr:hypothetical protein [Pseudomonas atacamensis]THF34509.1 hypothetical protein E5170_09645 [Pseudomonas atacamensis]
MKGEDPINIYFNEPAKSLLFSLADRKDPNGLATGSDDTFKHSISAVFTLFASLLDEHTPDLYPAEWQMIVDAQIPILDMHRLPSSFPEMKSRLVVGVEDLTGRDGEIHSGLLANKLAGFSSIQLCAISVHIQRYLVARKRGQDYKFPEIQFKG